MKVTLICSALALASLSVTLACGMEPTSSDAEGFDTVDSDREQAQAKRPDFGDGSACHVPTEGIGGGTRDGQWCCGVRTCDDRDTCGDAYGQQVESCASCTYYECIPGDPQPDPRGGDWNWRDWARAGTHAPATGGVYAP